MGALLAAATLTTFATVGAKSAEAISITSVTSSADYSSFINGGADPGVGTRLINFNDFTEGALLSASNPTVFQGTNQEATFSGDGRIVTGDVSGQYKAPSANAAGGSSDTTDTTKYLTLGGTNERGPVSLDFRFPIISKLGFLWGSIDDYNKVEFFRKGLIRGTFTGEDVFMPANGNQEADGTAFVNFESADENDYFDQVVFSSSQAAFEIDDIRYTEVPTPALLPGLIGMGAVALRKRKRVGEAQES